jgi:hypothetical protein
MGTGGGVDAESAMLASTAATMTLLTADAWIQVKKEIGGLWRRVRPAEADAVVAEIERCRRIRLSRVRR